MSQHELLAPNTTLAAGEPSPPVSAHKAFAALWGLVPILLGAVVEILRNATTLFAGAPAWVFIVATVLLMILGPIVSYMRVYATPNRLLQPVVVNPQP